MEVVTVRRVASALLTLVVASFILVACGDDGSDPGADVTGPTETAVETGPTGATATGPTGATATGATGATAEPPPGTDLEDGRHFGYLEAFDPDLLTLDLAYFYTGQEAIEQAEAHGDESPPPNDYYIVNDNPRLRDLEIAPEATISVIDWNRCCDELVSLDVGAFDEVFEATPTDGFVEMDGHAFSPPDISQYWLTLEGGVVVGIEEQYLP